MRKWLWALVVGLWGVGPVQAEALIGVPDMAPTAVADDGSLQEDWGRVSLRFDTDEPLAWEQDVDVDPAPTVTTQTRWRECHLRLSAYRAPAWPRGLDVLTATVRNLSSQPAQARLVLALPDHVEVGEETGNVGGRCVLVLPADRLPERAARGWGWTAGGQAMPGWARPQGECDPAFRNIRAGMGGVPLIYRFTVPAGSAWTVALGFCESYWAQPGQRPVDVYVEGTERRQIDPLALWGQHRPGCLLFEARDENGDGQLQIVSAPVKSAPDVNPILNVIWLFSPDKYVDLDDLIRGKLNSVAARYVDVGGERDQAFFEPGSLRFPLALDPGAEATLTFLLACPGASLPSLETSHWTPQSLRRAAEDVWGDWWEKGAQLSLPDRAAMAAYRQALAEILMSRGQADAYFVALPRPGGLENFSFAVSQRVIRALDVAGLDTEAERMLRLYWDIPLPGPLASLTPKDDGQWADATGDPCAHGWALEALGQHAALTADAAWARRVWPKVAAGVQWAAQANLTGPAAACLRRGLLAAARLAELAGADPAPLQAQAAALETETAEPEAIPDSPCVRAAETVVKMRNALLVEEGDALVLLTGVGESWLTGSGLRAEKMPTEFGPLSFRARFADDTLALAADLPDWPLPQRVIVCPPKLNGRRAAQAEVNGQPSPLDPNGRVTVTGAQGRLYVVVRYEG